MLTRQCWVDHSGIYGRDGESWLDEWCKRTQSTRNAGCALQGSHEQPATSGQRHLDVRAWKVIIAMMGVCEQDTQKSYTVLIS